MKQWIRENPVIIRTLAGLVAGVVVAFLADAGLDIDNEAVTASIVAVVTAIGGISARQAVKPMAKIEREKAEAEPPWRQEAPTIYISGTTETPEVEHP